MIIIIIIIGGGRSGAVSYAGCCWTNTQQPFGAADSSIEYHVFNMHPTPIPCATGGWVAIAGCPDQSINHRSSIVMSKPAATFLLLLLLLFLLLLLPTPAAPARACFVAQPLTRRPRRPASAAAAAAAAAADNPEAVDNPEAAVLFQRWFRGQFDNAAQVAEERAQGMGPGEGGGHEQIHCVLEPLPALRPGLLGGGERFLGTWVQRGQRGR
jgi:hypothetical protein